MFEFILYFYCQYFLSSWKQTGIWTEGHRPVQTLWTEDKAFASAGNQTMIPQMSQIVI